MKTLPLSILMVTALLLTACDAKDPFKPKTDLLEPNKEMRTMIIGGVPVHDKDYKLPEVLLTENIHRD